MSSKYSAIGDNSPENREHLEKVGYGEYTTWHYGEDGKEKSILISGMSSDFYPMIQKHIDDLILNETVVNCIGNPALFRAVTAMRDDSDKWQLFTDGIKWTLCYEESILMWRDIFNFPDKNLIHKASLAELQEHFK